MKPATLKLWLNLAGSMTSNWLSVLIAVKYRRGDGMSNTICLSCGAEFDRDLLLTDEELGNGYCPACMSDYIEFGYTESHDEEIPLIVVER